MKLKRKNKQQIQEKEPDLKMEYYTHTGYGIRHPQCSIIAVDNFQIIFTASLSINDKDLQIIFYELLETYIVKKSIDNDIISIVLKCSGLQLSEALAITFNIIENETITGYNKKIYLLINRLLVNIVYQTSLHPYTNLINKGYLDLNKFTGIFLYKSPDGYVNEIKLVGYDYYFYDDITDYHDYKFIDLILRVPVKLISDTSEDSTIERVFILTAQPYSHITIDYPTTMSEMAYIYRISIWDFINMNCKKNALSTHEMIRREFVKKIIKEVPKEIIADDPDKFIEKIIQYKYIKGISEKNSTEVKYDTDEVLKDNYVEREYKQKKFKANPFGDFKEAEQRDVID